MQLSHTHKNERFWKYIMSKRIRKKKLNDKSYNLFFYYDNIQIMEMCIFFIIFVLHSNKFNSILIIFIVKKYIVYLNININNIIS